jgi:hypothetical protein
MAMEEKDGRKGRTEKKEDGVKPPLGGKCYCD